VGDSVDWQSMRNGIRSGCKDAGGRRKDLEGRFCARAHLQGSEHWGRRQSG